MEYDVFELQNRKEDKYYERKSAKLDPKKIVKHIIAFANADGGILVVGIEDVGTLSGFSYDGAKSIGEFERAIYQQTIPNPKFTLHRESIINSMGAKDEILIINIDSSHNRIIRSTSDKVYLRMGDSSVELTYDQVKALEYDKGERYFEDMEILNASIEDIDERLMDRFREIKRTALSTYEILEARGMIEQGKPTNAALLLFGKNTSKFLPQSRIRFLRYNGNKAETGRRINLLKEFDYEGPIPILIEQITRDVRSQLRDFQFLDNDGRFKVVPEYPEFAWFEGIVNALTHRDYSYRGDYIRITMYDDRLEIFSPGSLPNIVTLDNMLVKRYSRNPRISRTLADFGWVKELNEGVKRIYEEMEILYLKSPKYSEPDGSSVQLVLENNIITRHLRAGDRTNEMLSNEKLTHLPDVEKIVVRFLYNAGNINVAKAAELLGKSLPYTRKLLKGMTEKKILSWHGSGTKDPTQYYTLNLNVLMK